MCLATTKTETIPDEPTWDQKVRAIFVPILKKDKIESWEANYRNWFVTTKEVLDYLSSIFKNIN